MDEKMLDRISQAYKGELGEQSKEDAYKRIDWIRSNVKGDTVLDVGCSQGITSILLAKEGKTVVGIDSERSRIEYAENDKMSEGIGDNLTFVCDDFLCHKFDSKFDCVIMGEVLEHVFSPVLFLEKAKNLLTEDGRLIVTVPFGINPFPDHKRTYYFLEIFRQINERIYVSDIVFIESWLGLFADLSNKESKIQFDENFIEKLEDAFFKIDSRKQAGIDRVLSWHNSSNVKVETANKKINELEATLKKIKEQNEEQINKLTSLKEKYDQNIREQEKDIYDLKLLLNEKTIKLDTLRADHSARTEDLNKITSDYSDVLTRSYDLEYENKIKEYELKSLREENELTKRTLQEASSKLEEAQSDLATAKEGIEVRNKKNRDAEGKISSLELEIEKLNKTLLEYEARKEASDILQQELAQLSTELSEKEQDIREKEKKIYELLKQNKILITESEENQHNIAKLKSSIFNLQISSKKQNDIIVETEKKANELSNQLLIIKKELSIEEEKSKELNNRLYKANKENKMYERLVEVKLYNFARKIKKAIKEKKSLSSEEKSKTISIIIPTYKENEWIEQCIDSVLKQTYSPEKIEIIICVNGGNQEYYKKIRDKYHVHKNITVIFEKEKGASVARNAAIKKSKGEYIYFLDDDDYLTCGLIAELVSYADENIDIVCGKMSNLEKDGKVAENTYINNVIRQAGEGLHNDYHQLTSLFVTICGKLYRAKLLKEVFSPVNEGFTNTEDVVFWCENAYKMNKPFYVVNSNSKESYIRRVRDESLSRPSIKEKMKFYIEDRIKVIEYIEKYIFTEEIPMMHKRFVYVLIQAQENHMLNAFSNILSDIERTTAKKMISECKSQCLNKGNFSAKKGIAFCHNFSPFVDASAFVATKRLREIDSIANELICWDIICADMSAIRTKDIFFDMFFAKSQYNDRKIYGKAYWNEKAQYEWGVKSSAKIMEENKSYQYIYSRSMWPASHVAAYYYKKAHPEAFWYAEFSDPLYMTAECEVRKPSLNYDGDDSFLNNFWYDIECFVFENADKVILNNDNQKNFMKENNELLNTWDDVKYNDKCIVAPHPVISSNWCNVIKTEYRIDDSKINIAYFGSFYSNRGIDGMFELLKNKEVVLHIFSQQKYNIDSLENIDFSRVHLNDAVSQLECLNIGSKMDYLYIEENQFPGRANPYLHSKLADYVTTGTNIIAKIFCDDSPIEKYDYNRMIKVRDINDSFVCSLKKQKKIQHGN